MTMNNLGNVLRELGEPQAAREAYEEALAIYTRLAEECPAAFGRNLLGVLGNYTKVAPEDDNDRWWRMWKQFQKSAAGEQGDEAAGDAGAGPLPDGRG